jgi:hypothetical protein
MADTTDPDTSSYDSSERFNAKKTLYGTYKVVRKIVESDFHVCDCRDYFGGVHTMPRQQLSAATR